MSELGFPRLFATKDVKRVLNDLLPVLREADYGVANLEAAATGSGECLEKILINLRASPSNVRVLADVGTRAVALSSNHILDYGAKGLEDTFEVLGKTGIVGCGAGDT